MCVLGRSRIQHFIERHGSYRKGGGNLAGYFVKRRMVFVA
jgi:hypothetical protein